MKLQITETGRRYISAIVALRLAADACEALGAYGDCVARTGEFHEPTARSLRIEAAIRLAAVADAMAREGSEWSSTAERVGHLILAGFRSPDQLQTDAQWMRGIAVEMRREARAA